MQTVASKHAPRCLCPWGNARPLMSRSSSATVAPASSHGAGTMRIDSCQHAASTHPRSRSTAPVTFHSVTWPTGTCSGLGSG